MLCKYRCQKPDCRAEVEIAWLSSETESPACCLCGGKLKKVYTTPVFSRTKEQRELEATVIKAGEAGRQAAILRAEAAKQSAILEAEGSKSAQIALAEAQQEKLKQEGLGRAAAVE